MFFNFIRIKKIRVKNENQTLLFKVKRGKKHRKIKNENTVNLEKKMIR